MQFFELIMSCIVATNDPTAVFTDPEFSLPVTKTKSLSKKVLGITTIYIPQMKLQNSTNHKLGSRQ